MGVREGFQPQRTQRAQRESGNKRKNPPRPGGATFQSRPNAWSAGGRREGNTRMPLRGVGWLECGRDVYIENQENRSADRNAWGADGGDNWERRAYGAFGGAKYHSPFLSAPRRFKPAFFRSAARMRCAWRDVTPSFSPSRTAVKCGSPRMNCLALLSDSLNFSGVVATTFTTTFATTFPPSSSILGPIPTRFVASSLWRKWYSGKFISSKT